MRARILWGEVSGNTLDMGRGGTRRPHTVVHREVRGMNTGWKVGNATFSTLLPEMSGPFREKPLLYQLLWRHERGGTCPAHSAMPYHDPKRRCQDYITLLLLSCQKPMRLRHTPQE